jgi:hypothetical protein
MRRGAEAVCSERYAILAESLRGLDPVVFENTAMVHCARQRELCRLGELRCCACADVKARGQ